MSCGCGKKKCNGKCGISPSVLQINNNECTLFHKVEIPAVMGDETTNPPKTGAYRNVLLYYEASGNSYLYSSDGIPTKLTGVVSDYEVLTNKPSINGVVLIKNKTLADLGIISAIDSAVADEATARTNADNALSDRITTNANNIAANATAISNEVTARTNADNTLSARISGNTTAINNEKTARENADTALSNRITANANAISAETTARENADNALSGRITANADAISGEKTARENADAGLQDQITAVKATADSAVQPDDIDKTVMSDLAVDSNSSTAQVILKESKVNLKTGATSSEQTSLPVASSSQAGVMNSATYDAVTSNTSNINAIMNGAVAITGLPANPSQSDLTTAWKNETGLSSLINRASVYDVTNNKVWTYYTNDTTWHAASNTSSVTVNTFTNSSEGTIKGSTNIGQVFAENDGTGSVNGWDALSDAVSNNTSKLAGIESGAEVNVQSDWNVSDSSSDAYIKNKPTIGNGTLTIQKNGTTIDTFTANSTTNKTVNIAVPTVNDATLTIQKNGDTVQTFTANSSSNKTANIEVPTKTSELDNDAGFIANDTHQVCGEGGNITLNTTTFEPLEMNHLGGATSQQTYTGKNLTRYPYSAGGYGNGITFTDNGDGSITLNGQNNGSGNSSFYLIAGPGHTSETLTLPAGTYYFANPGADGIMFSAYDGTRYYDMKAENNYAMVLSAQTTLQNVYIQVARGTTTAYNNTKVWPMLSTQPGQTASDWEPYVGGVPAPNPDYPQAVQTVTGENVVKICGKNLFDKNAISTGYLNADGTLSSDSAYKTSDFIAVKPNTAYYKTYTASPRTKYFDSARQPLNTTTYQDISIGGAAGTFTTPANATYVRFSLPVTGVDLDTTQLELGATATAYEPYQEQSYEVNLGKNLFDNQYYKTHKSDFVNAYQGYYFAIELGNEFKNQITASMALNGTAQTGLVFALTDSIGSAPSANSRVMAINGSITTRSYDFRNSSHIYLQIGATTQQTALNTGIDALMDNYNIQVELGSQATSYAPYFTPIELCKIGDYQDYIYKSDGKWYVHKEIGHILYTENIFGIAANNNSGENTASATGAFFVWGGYAGLMSENLGTLNEGSISGNADANAMTDGTFATRSGTPDRLYFRNTAYIGKTGNEMKAILAANSGGASIWYALATPTDTEITNEALTEQLEALWEADGYDSQTNIALTYAKGNAQGILSVCQYPSHLPVATKSKLGTIIVGHGLDIEDDGRLDVIVDSALSDSSINPVQNKAITTELNSKADISSVPTKTSQLENDSGFVVNDTTEICDEGSDITLNGTLLEPLDVKKIEGATSQQTYSGKNLYPLIASTSSNGITYTQNADGTYNISGTSTAQANAILWLDDISAFEDGQTYTISVSPAPTNMSALVEAYNGTTWQRTLFDANATNPIKTSAINMANADRLKFSLRVQNGYTVNLQNLKIQLEKSSSATAWEKYVGGTASPNPDYPQAVQTVTGENVVKITGKNLADIPDFSISGSGYAVGASNGAVSVDSTTTNRAISLCSGTDGGAWLPAYTSSSVIDHHITGNGGSYTISLANVAKTITGTQALYVSVYTNKRSVANTTLTSSSNFAPSTITLDSDEHIKDIWIWAGGNTTYNASFNMQLEKGSSATAYEPYQGQSYEVNLGKNLFGGSIYKENYVIASNGAENPATGGVITTAVRVEPNTTYTASANWDASAPDKYMRVGIYASDMTFISRPSSTAAGAPTTFTTPANARYVRLSYFVPATEVQLELGSTATSYAAYFEPIELCNIPGTDYRDRFIPRDGKWYVHKEVDRKVLDGSEDWVLAERSGSNNGVFYVDYNKIGTVGAKNNGAFSNYARFISGFVSRVGQFDTHYSQWRFYAPNNTITLNEWKVKLGATPLDLYYLPATPTDTEITNEALIAQLNALWEADGVEGVTNIFTVSDGVNERAILSVCQYPSHLPIATKTKLGTVVVGHGLDIEADGKLDVVVDDDFSTESEHPVQNKVITNALAGKADNTDLSTVAMTGSYDDLTGKPTIPTVNNATLTIQKNGTNVATFTANSSTNVTANITAPVVTMTTTDPGEGGALAANNFIGVYV